MFPWEQRPRMWQTRKSGETASPIGGEMDTKSVGQAMARVLRSNACRRLDFYVGSFHVDGAGLELVAKALDGGKIKVVIDDPFGDGGATYGVRENTIWVTSADICNTALGRNLVVHECVHALYDIRKLLFEAVEGEATAYITGALYDGYALRELFGAGGGGSFGASTGMRGGPVGGKRSRAIGISKVYASSKGTTASAIGVSKVGGGPDDAYVDHGAAAIMKAAYTAAAAVFDRPAAKIPASLVTAVRSALLAHPVYADHADKHGKAKKVRFDGI